MPEPGRLAAQARRFWLRIRGAGTQRVFYDPAFRLPISSLNARHGLEVRRADFVVWYLAAEGWLHADALISPLEIGYAQLARVHTPRLLDSLANGDGLATVYQADPHELQVDEVMRSVRKAVGATLEGARLALEQGGPVLSLLGGFHHASPDKAAGLCPVNDLAVAIAALRDEGFAGLVAILDLDAHPPDGTADCLAGQTDVWIGSISGSDWGPLVGVDETVLPAGSDDRSYLAALRALTDRMPRPDLAFVVAGGDVIAGDRAGLLGMSVDGVRERDLHVLDELRGVPSVWVPGGGYSESAWRVLAGTALAVLHQSKAPIPASVQPMAQRFRRIAQRLEPERLGLSDDAIDLEELEVELGLRRPVDRRMLGVYTKEGLRYAMQRYGVLPYLERLGYHGFRFEIDQEPLGQRMRIVGKDNAGNEHVLSEVVVELTEISERKVVYVHWLTLRHPLAVFGQLRSALPGQEVPGLGLAHEVGELLEQAARRVGAEGIAFRPSWYHTAWESTERVRFVEDARQGRYEALTRDLGDVPKHVLSKALDEERVLLNGQPYAWEPSDMVLWLDGRPASEPGVEIERERSRFSLVPAEG